MRCARHWCAPLFQQPGSLLRGVSESTTTVLRELSSTRMLAAPHPREAFRPNLSRPAQAP